MVEWRGRLRGLVPSVLLLLSSLAASEILLTVLSWTSEDVAVLLSKERTRELQTRQIEDHELGNRGNPEFIEHDGRGFRNDHALDRADIVTLGDSHTYGTSVAADESWPRELARLTGQDVYNMAFGGWGPSHAVAILPEAMHLRPDVLLFGIYFGNDLYDDFAFANRHGVLDRYADDEEIEEIRRLQSESAIEEEVGFLFRSGRAGSAALSGPGGNPVDRPRPLRDVLSDHSRLYGLLRAVKDQIVSRHGAAILGRDFDEVVEGLSPRQRAFVSVFDDSQWRTVFTSRYRARVLDRNDPRIRVGFDILRQKLTEMRDSAENVGTAFLVVLLPTKEFVFQPRVERMSDHDSLADLVRSEKAFRDSLIGYLQAEGIGVVDPLDALRSSRRQPYFESGNGHPTALGHELIAAQVVAHIAADSLLERD